MAPSRELAFAIECCRFAFLRGEEPLRLPATDLDWSLFLRLVRFHRVQGLAWHALATSRDKIGADVAAALADDAATIAAANLRSAVECGQLLEDFEHSKIRILFLKGLTLGALGYGNASIKAAVDIDLLVAEEEVAEAAQVLQKRGYDLSYPNAPATPERLRTWHGRRKESVWLRPDERTHIDLHSRLSDNRALVSSLDVHSACQNVAVMNGIDLPTLGPDELFAYLCVHGASSAWFRLKWITDLAALLHQYNADEIRRLYDHSQELGAHRAADQALLLADALYGSLEDTNLRPRLSEDRSSLRLAESALRQIANSREPTSTPLGTWRIHLTQLLLKPGLGFKFGEAVRQISAALA